VYAPKNLGSRHCFRCDHALTDAASMTEGVGPICRHLDNALLARLIPSDLPAALKAYATVDPLTLTPETLDTFLKLEASLRDSKAAETQDWRVSVKRIEWILSHHQTYQNIQALKAIVLALGYVGLVSLWNGDAATGLATVFAIDGRLTLTGPRNKAGHLALKKIGAKFHPASPEFPKAVWSLPADKFREFRFAIISHWPHFEGLLEAIEVAQAYAEEQAAIAAEAARVATEKAAEAAKLTAAQKPVVPAAKPTINGEPIISIVEVGNTLKVKTPFRTSYIAELRSTPKDLLPRFWNKAEGIWEFPLSHKAKVEALVAKHYGI